MQEHKHLYYSTKGYNINESDLALFSKLCYQGKEVCSYISVANIRGADQRFHLKILISRFL